MHRALGLSALIGSAPVAIRITTQYYEPVIGNRAAHQLCSRMLGLDRN